MEKRMSTPTIEQMYRHWSVRDYRLDHVPRELVERIVCAGQRASTSSNLQTYSVVALSDAARRSRLAELCGNQEHIRQAPIFLTWCADVSRLARVGRRRGYDIAAEYVEAFLVAAVDATLAMQNAALAAESLGLGMCYIGAIRNHPAEVIELLDLPQLVFPVSGMTLGWPASEAFLRPRLPLEAILHWEHYDSSGEPEVLEAYDQAMIETGIYQGRQVPVPGAEGEMEDYGWQEHSARRMSRPVRKDLRQVLADQGYGLK
jgi:FMN reductase (NADPH)